MKTIHRILAVLLAVLLLFSCAAAAFAFPASEEGDARDETFGIAKGYVRTKEVYRSPEGNTHSIVWAYNNRGQLVKEVETSKGDGYSGSVTTTWAYDKKGNLVKEVIYENDCIITTTYVNNAKGKVTTEIRNTVYEDNSVYQTTRTYAYNKAGKLTKALAYYDDCEEVTTCTYSKSGLLTKEVRTQSYEDNTQSRYTTTYAYDKNGNETKKSMVDKDRYGSVEKRSYVSVYDEKNRCVKMTETYSFVNGDYTAANRDVTTYAYDKHGNVTKEVFKSTQDDGSRRSVVFVNTYDADGNRIKQTVTEKSADYNAKTTTAYTFDKKGRLLKEVTVSKGTDGTDRMTEAYAYDKAGNLTKYVFSGSYGKSVTTYAYQKIGA